MTRLAVAARRHWPLPAVCALFLLIGAFVPDDYGASPDAKAQREIGKAALDYLAGDGERALDQLYGIPSRYYGAAFDAPLVLLLERILGLEDSRDILFGRHLLSHLFFLAGGVFCYLLVLRLFHSRGLALVATVLFLLHPRIYAHSFFNSKDIPFLAMFMIALYLVHRAFRRDTLGAFLLCGAGVGLLVNLRIMGVILFAAVLALRALDLGGGGGQARKRVLLTGAGFALAALLTYYASLPVLWTDPFGRGAEALKTLSAGPPLVAYNLFQGELLYAPGGPPFDYLPVWAGITTPPAVLLLAFVGAMALAWRVLRHPLAAPRNGPLRFAILLPALPIAANVAIVVLDANVSNNWRHLYFLYAPVLLLAIAGLRCLASPRRGRWTRIGAYALTGAAAAVTVVSMVRIHPHQSEYFNVLVDRTTPERLLSRFEILPYPPGSSRAMLAGIAGDHPSAVTRVALPSGRTVPPDYERRFIETRDFRSGERNFLGLDRRECLASGPPRGTHAIRAYANTLYCMVDPVAWLSALRETMTAEPLARSVYDIRYDGRLLTYVRDECPVEDVEGGGPRFFLHLTPVDVAEVTVWRRTLVQRHGFDNLDHIPRRGVARIDGTCVTTVLLPDYAIAAIRTGQIGDGGVLWEVEITFGEEAPDYAAARREALAGEPVARSVYDIHLDGRTLTYVRDECTDGEADARFFLHVVPADVGDLPERRREHGFDNLDFTLATRGARLDGNCVALARLPGYPIATVRTGQYDGTGALWAAEFTLPGGE